MITFTPEELFRFAARLRTNLKPEKIEERVQDVIKRLRLTNCKKTLVGGFFMKGLSGGERKRTSIGYELITNPSLLLLDEPTSGLDSTTAYTIVKLLK
jgi:ABC-type multidrug transport system ATPase subunit